MVDGDWICLSGRNVSNIEEGNFKLLSKNERPYLSLVTSNRVHYYPLNYYNAHHYLMVE
jgi:hypothetical protein